MHMLCVCFSFTASRDHILMFKVDSTLSQQFTDVSGQSQTFPFTIFACQLQNPLNLLWTQVNRINKIAVFCKQGLKYHPLLLSLSLSPTSGFPHWCVKWNWQSLTNPIIFTEKSHALQCQSSPTSLHLCITLIFLPKNHVCIIIMVVHMHIAKFQSASKFYPQGCPYRRTTPKIEAIWVVLGVSIISTIFW